MKKPVLLLLFVAALVIWTGFLPHGELSAQPTKTSKKTVKVRKKSAKEKPRTTARKKVSRKQSLTVLREYLPEYADLHATKSPNLDNAFVPLPYNFDYRSPFVSPQLRVDLIRNIDEWLGTRYRYGGISKRGVDCSGFTSAVVSETLNQVFRGTSRWQAEQFLPIFERDSLQFGDMVFFAGRNRRSTRIGHVGIYLGNGVFTHSSTGKGVIYSHMTDGYYDQRFRWGGRFTTAPAGVHKPGIYALQ